MLLKNSLILMIGSILGKFSLVLSQILLARFLGPYNYGTFILGWTVLRISGIFSLFGIDKTVIFFGSKEIENKNSLNKILSISIILSLFFSLFSSLIIYTFSSQISIFFSNDELLKILPYFCTVNFFYINNKILASFNRIKNKMFYSVLIDEFIQPISFTIIIMLLYFLNEISIFNILNFLLVTFIVTFIFGIKFLYKFFPSYKFYLPTSNDYIKFVKHSFFTFSAGVSSMMLLWTDRLMIGKYCSSDLVGLYQACSQIVMIFAMIIMAIGLSIGPTISSYYHKNNYKQISHIYKYCVNLIAYICLPLVISILINSELFISTIYGDDYSSGALVLILLCLGKIIHIFCGPIGYILVLTNHQKNWAILSFIVLVINIFLNNYLISKYSITGAGLSTSFSIIILFISGSLYAHKKLSIKLFNHQSFKIFLCFILTIIIMEILEYLFPFNLLGLVLFVLVTFVIYITFTVFLKLNNNFFKLLMKSRYE